MFERVVRNIIEKRLTDNKVIIVTGPRQVGKTTLIEQILSDKSYLFINGDDHFDRSLFENINLEKLRTIVSKYKYIFIDEAQKIDSIGDALKLIYDKIKDVKVLVSGSSSLEINNKINESLTGRKWEFNLYPISWVEFEKKTGSLIALKQLEIRLVYGMYPEVLNNFDDQKAILKELVSSYLYKDVLSLKEIKRPELVDKIVRALAYQIGSEVSYNEIAQLVGADKNTVNKYIDLLCQSFVIFKLPSYSRNMRNEIKTNQKIYFYDNGIRNAIIGNLNPLELRNDHGQLWENFLMSERLKYNSYQKRLVNMYFWRTTTQKEIDLVEEGEGNVSAFEFKWSERKKAKVDSEFKSTYKATFNVIDKNNFLTFLS